MWLMSRTITKNNVTEHQLILKFVYVAFVDMLLIECLILLFAMSLDLDFHASIIL